MLVHIPWRKWKIPSLIQGWQRQGAGFIGRVEMSKAIVGCYFRDRGGEETIVKALRNTTSLSQSLWDNLMPCPVITVPLHNIWLQASKHLRPLLTWSHSQRSSREPPSSSAQPATKDEYRPLFCRKRNPAEPPCITSVSPAFRGNGVLHRVRCCTQWLSPLTSREGTACLSNAERV